MAINFPSSPSNNDIFTDNNGQQWVYSSSDNSWTALGISAPGGLSYQGGLDITAAPPTAESGQFWSVETGGAANAGFAPGVTGTIVEGSFVLFDGVNWELLETSSLWNRTGGLIQPVNQNDIIQTDSGLRVGPSGTPTIRLNSNGSGLFNGLLTAATDPTPFRFGSGDRGGQINLYQVSNVPNGGVEIEAIHPFSSTVAFRTQDTRRVLIDQVGQLLIGGDLESTLPDPNITLKGSDGSAKFTGTNRAVTYVQTADLTSAPSAGVEGTMLQSGTVFATRGNNVNVWEGRAEGSTAVTSSIKPNGSASFSGDITCTDNSKGLILKSPNGTSFRLSVANDGTLSATSI